MALVEAYAKAQGMFRTKTTPDPVFTDVLKLDLAHGRAVARRAEAAAGPRAAEGRAKPASPRAMDKEFNKAARDSTSACRSRAASTISAMATW